jgi:hypothetical protein
MARVRPRDGSKRPAPAENEIATATAVAPNGNGPAKAYRHRGEKRRNIPPAAIAAEGKVPAAPKLNYSYSPRLDPILRFDATGASDKLPDLLEKAKREPLTDAEARLLAEALRRQEPWLEWAGKREANGFVVDPVALHIHERVSRIGRLSHRLESPSESGDACGLREPSSDAHAQPPGILPAPVLTPGAIRATNAAEICQDRRTAQYRHWSRERDSQSEIRPG